MKRAMLTKWGKPGYYDDETGEPVSRTSETRGGPIEFEPSSLKSEKRKQKVVMFPNMSESGSRILKDSGYEESEPSPESVKEVSRPKFVGWIYGSKKFNDQEDGKIGTINQESETSKKGAIGDKCKNFVFEFKLQSIGNHEQLAALDQEMKNCHEEVNDVTAFKGIFTRLPLTKTNTFG